MALLGIATVFGGMIIFNAFLGQSMNGNPGFGKVAIPGKVATTESDKSSRTVTLKYDELVEDVQRELLATGHFQGLVDGVDGPKTNVAIETYQQQNGLAVTGVSSPNLLEHIRFMKKVAQASEFTGSINAVDATQLPEPEMKFAPLPKPVAKSIAKPVAKPAAVELDDEVQPPVLKKPSKTPVKPAVKVVARPKLKPVEKKIAKTKDTSLEDLLAETAAKPLENPKVKPAVKLAENETVTLKLQRRLAKLGFDPGTRSGKMDEATKAAILSFELENGLNMEGKVSKTLLLALQRAEQKRQAALPN